MKQFTAIVIGAGSRGSRYTDLMGDQPDKFKVVGVAEPIIDRLNYIKNKHGVDEAHCFDTWEKILDIPKFADIAIISTMDQMHLEPSLKALELGYDLLLEKPAAITPRGLRNDLQKGQGMRPQGHGMTRFALLALLYEAEMDPRQRSFGRCFLYRAS